MKCKLIALAAPMTSVLDDSAECLGYCNRQRSEYIAIGNNDGWKGTATFGSIIPPLIAMAQRVSPL